MFNYGSTNYITPNYFYKLKQQLAQLYRQRAKLGKDLQYAREPGNDAENASYEQIRTQTLDIDTRMQAIQSTLQTATLIHSPQSSTAVEMGNVVELENENERRHYMIVGSLEADPRQYKVSDQSPIGSSLLGKQIGDSIEIGNGTKHTYTIRAIR